MSILSCLEPPLCAGNSHKSTSPSKMPAPDHRLCGSGIIPLPCGILTAEDVCPRRIAAERTIEMIHMLALFVLLLAAPTAWAASPPKVGDVAPDFALSALQGETVRLSDAIKTGTVVLIALRGYPGYQCPVCNQPGSGLYPERAGLCRCRSARGHGVSRPGRGSQGAGAGVHRE